MWRVLDKTREMLIKAIPNSTKEEKAAGCIYRITPLAVFGIAETATRRESGAAASHLKQNAITFDKSDNHHHHRRHILCWSVAAGASQVHSHSI